MTLTKSWLQKQITDLEATRDEIPFGLDEDGNNTLAALKLALAGMEAEPVAYMTYKGYLLHAGDPKVAEYSEPMPLYDAQQPLTTSERAELENYRNAQQVDSYLFHMAASAIDDLLMSKDRSGAGVWADVPAKLRRAAMLQGADGTLTNEGTMPVNQFKPVADLYGLTSPTGGETSFTFDAVEARDFIDGGWSCQEYVELGRFQEAMLQNGNSPAQSDCCPEQNYIAPAQDGDSPVIPDGWIPVSERMPGSQEWVIVFAKWDNQQVLCWDDVANRWTDFEDQSYYADMFTHWMPLPAAPQQETE